MAKNKRKAGKKAKNGTISSFNEIHYTASFQSENLLNLYVENTKFREMVDSGSYVYVDGKIVLNSSRYITFVGGRARIRADIRDDVPDYCLHYRKIVEVPCQKSKMHSICAQREFPRYNRHHDALYRESVKLPKREKTKNELEDAKLISSVNDVTRENILAIVGNAHRAGENFSEALTRFMSESHITEEELSGLTGLAPKTIQRMRNSNLRTSLKSVIAVCVALSLDLYNGMYLVHLAGFELTNSYEDKVYYFILGFAYKETVYDCNRMLERLLMKPLTKL